MSYRLSPALMQPIVSDEVVAVLADVVLGQPLNDTVEVGGPEAIPLDELARELLSARQDPRQIVADTHARYFGAELNDQSLIPGPKARLGSLSSAIGFANPSRRTDPTRSRRNTDMMKLYYAPGACSLADHIALLEVGARFEAEAVDIRTKRTASGEDFRAINPKGYVPALVLDDCGILTENIAVLDWIADQYPQLRRNGVLSRTRQLEMLAFISTVIHRAFKPLWHGGGEEEKQKARETVASLHFAVIVIRTRDH